MLFKTRQTKIIKYYRIRLEKTYHWATHRFSLAKNRTRTLAATKNTTRSSTDRRVQTEE